MNEEGLKALLEILQGVEIIKKCGLGSKTETKKILNMERRNDISVDVVNKIPIREYGRKQQYQTSKYTILKNGAYYVNHDRDKNQKVRGKVAVTCPQYGHEGCGFKLVIQTFIYKLLPPKLGMLRSTLMWSGRPFRWARKIQGTRNYPSFLKHLGPVLLASRNTVWVATVRVITLDVFQSPHNLFEISQI